MKRIIVVCSEVEGITWHLSIVLYGFYEIMLNISPQILLRQNQNGRKYLHQRKLDAQNDREGEKMVKR